MMATSRTGTAAWKAMRTRVLREEPTCQLRYPGICRGKPVICDHKRPTAAGGSDERINLQGACQACSDRKSSLEGHYLAGHSVECPWPDDPRLLRSAAPKPVGMPRVIQTGL
jgi:5-methylcytosine-specific restriction endonuclease McrA